MNSRKLKREVALYKKEAQGLIDSEQFAKIKKAINLASLASATVGAGLSQLPGSDAPIIVGIQVKMIQTIADTFGIKLSKKSAQTLIATGLATLLGRRLSQLLLGLIPLAGNIINASTAALITQLMGWAMSINFAKESKKN